MTAERAHLLIPAGLVDRLDIPHRSLRTGDAGPIWLDAPVNPNPLRRRPTVRLPYDQPTATAMRRDRFRRPATLVVLLAVFTHFLVDAVTDYEMTAQWHLLSSGGGLALSVAQLCWLNPPLPVALPGGDLYLRDVPAGLALEWIERNPGVRVVDRRPVVRHFGPGAYAVGAVLCLIAAVQVAILVAVDGRENPLGLWLAVPALAAGAVALAYRSMPWSHVTFGRPARGRGTGPGR